MILISFPNEAHCIQMTRVLCLLTRTREAAGIYTADPQWETLWDGHCALEIKDTEKISISENTMFCHTVLLHMHPIPPPA